MARRRRRSEADPVDQRLDVLRDLTTPITRPLPGLHHVRRAEVLEVEDRRRYHPLGALAPPSRALPRANEVRPSRNPATPWGFNFRIPNAVAICVRRKQRKEIIHAKRIAGKRGLSGGKRNVWSTVGCK